MSHVILQINLTSFGFPEKKNEKNYACAYYTNMEHGGYYLKYVISKKYSLKIFKQVHNTYLYQKIQYYYKTSSNLCSINCFLSGQAKCVQKLCSYILFTFWCGFHQATVSSLYALPSSFIYLPSKNAKSLQEYYINTSRFKAHQHCSR